MNSLVGKSTGIALLMAAALLAALFAMGVFGPAAVDAGVKGTPAPTAELSEIEPGAPDVTLTVTFEVNDDVDGAPTNDGGANGDDIRVTIEANLLATALAAGDEDQITVTQNGVNVGSVVINDAGIIVLGEPGTNGNPIIAEDELTTLVITGLTLGNSPDEYDITIAQEATGDSRVANVTVGPSVSDVSVALSDEDVSAENVEMELKFTPDTESTDATTGQVVIQIFETDYLLEGVDDQGDRTNDYAIGITVSAKQIDNTTDPTVVEASADSFVSAAVGPPAVGAHTVMTIHTFDEDKEVTVTIEGLTNRDTGRTVTVTFAQGNQSPAATDSVDVLAPVPTPEGVILSSYKADSAVKITINVQSRKPGSAEVVTSTSRCADS